MKRSVPLLVALLLAASGTIDVSAAEWEDHTKLHAGKERPRAAFASFESVEAAKGIRPETCSRRLLLDSETAWRFRWSRRPEERPVGFQAPD